MNTKELTLFNNNTLLEKSNALSFANSDIKLSLTQMYMLSLAILNRQADARTSSFTLKELESQAEITKYQKKRALKDTTTLRRVGFTFFDADYLDESIAEGKMVTYNIIERIEYDNGVFNVKWTESAMPLLQGMKARFMQIDLKIIQFFKSQYSLILYDMLKSEYQKSRIKVITKTLDDLKKDFHVENTASYNRNFSNFRAKVLDVAIEDINEYSELTVSYTPIYSNRSVQGITFEWQSTKIDYLATKKQIDAITKLFKELSTFATFSNNDDYDEIRRFLTETDYRDITKNAANSIIKTAKSLLKDFQKEEKKVLESPIIINLDDELYESLYQPVFNRLAKVDKYFEDDHRKEVAMLLHYDKEFTKLAGSSPMFSEEAVVTLLATNIAQAFKRSL